MDKKTLTYITIFTALIATALALYILSSILIKPSTQKPITEQQKPQPKDTEVVFPKATPTFTFSPKEPESARIVGTPPPEQKMPDYQKRPPQLVKVEIATGKFVPSSVELMPGDVIKWTNNDTVPHRLQGKTWKSGVIKPGENFSQQFDISGTFQYYTEADPNMAGTVIVK